MLDLIYDFILNNWPSIIITSLFGLVFGLLFFLLSTFISKRWMSSVEKERQIKAKETMLDMLESRVIAKQPISESKIETLLKAISREYSVDLYSVITPISLIEDLQLRFEESHHLNQVQKEEYCNKLELVADELKREAQPIRVPQKYVDIVNGLSENIKADNKKGALASLNLLTEKVREREELYYSSAPIIPLVRMLRRNPIFFMMVIIFYLIFLTMMTYPLFSSAR